MDDPTTRVLAAVTPGEPFADRYLVEGLLGRGGMGSVYRVRDLELDELVALKLLETATPEFELRFRREVRLARRVTHRNIARTFDLGEHRGLRYLTMEFVDGESLRERAARARPRVRELLAVTRQIAAALAAAHAAAVVHRDLKPANVMLERGGRVVLTDFGVARALHGEDASLDTQGTLGTPAYMAPEQLAGEPVGPATDLYALGLMIHELLLGALPFAAATPMQTALARLSAPAPELRERGVDPQLAALVTELLARDPSARPSAAQLDGRLAALEIDEPGSDRSSTTSATTATSATTSTASASPARRQRLAVLPFVFRGPERDRYLAEALADELVDLLAMTQGLRVVGVGATARFAERRDRDPRTIGRELGVDAVVDATVQIAGEQLRVVARLVDGDSGFQRWTERFDGSLGDVFELQDRLAKRIAEALRIELEQSSHRGDASPEAIEQYLRARALARLWEFRGEDGAIARFQRCLALAPGFRPALAAYAHACVRAWFAPRQHDDPDWQALAEQAIAAAQAGAPELPETLLASARASAYDGDLAGAVRQLRHALTIAPTYPEAHQYLGLLQLDGGRARDGLARLELSLELEPGLVLVLPGIARYHALRGDLPEYERWIARFFATRPRSSDAPAWMLQARIGGWFGEPERSSRAADELAQLGGLGNPLAQIARTFAAEHIDADTLERMFTAFLPAVPNPNFRANAIQVACEIALVHGYDALALTRLAELETGIFVDLDWLERCPLLERLRGEEAYRRCLAATRARVEAIGWR